MSKCIWGHSLACTGLPLHSFMHFWAMWQSLSITEKVGEKLGQPQASRPRGDTPLFNPVHREPMALPLPEFHQSTSCSSLLCSFCSCFSPNSLEKEEKDLLLLHSHLHFICISCLPSSLCKNVFVVVLLPRKNGFVVRHRPQERFCGVLSPTRMIFVRGNHAPCLLYTSPSPRDS